MKIIVVGGTGTIGKAVVKELAKRHTVVTVGHNSGELRADIHDVKSIEKMYQAVEKTGKFDAVISTTGNLHFAPISEFTEKEYEVGLKSKLMGQVNLVLIGQKYINDNGSFTLTSGILSHEPVRLGTSGSMVNSALNGFVIGAAIELQRNIRINVVSPTVLTESMDKYADFFYGFEPAPASRVALAYSKSVEGAQTGQVYNVW
ncbi:MAG TPA: short chain dehydrogenase [Gammaproteobacteria bacterium]|nr:short chain dehydrogenase [Gammaproteobacteria bacterium]